MNSFPHGIMFHHFYNNIHPTSQGAISSSDLEQLILNLGKDRILTPQEWMDCLEKDAFEPHHACLTFDDTLQCQFDIAKPVLDRLNIKAFWSAVSTGKYCNGNLFMVKGNGLGLKFNGSRIFSLANFASTKYLFAWAVPLGVAKPEDKYVCR